MRRWAVITGAAGGIGQAMVKTFSSNGYDVIAVDILSQPLNSVDTHFLQVDLAKTVNDEIYANQIFDKIKAFIAQDGLHALINNAAIQILGSVDDLSRNDWQKTLDVNLLAPFIWVQALLPSLEKNQGSVVNISSIHAKLTKKNFVAYATSKAALSAMTRAMAVDLGPRIRVNAIEPSAIETEMLKSGFSENYELYTELMGYHPRMRIGDPAEVAALAIALSGDGMNFLSGCSIGLDGGIASRLHDPS